MDADEPRSLVYLAIARMCQYGYLMRVVARYLEPHSSWYRQIVGARRAHGT
jgi:hypothetical protein